MNERPPQFIDIRVGLSVTEHDLRALQELGDRLAGEGPGRIVTDPSPALAVDLAVNFIVCGGLWSARRALGLPGEDDA
jgi:hypothetical protein